MDVSLMPEFFYIYFILTLLLLFFDRKIICQNVYSKKVLNKISS
jgi:hypothetical protein